MLRWTVNPEGGPTRARHAAVAVRHKVYSFGGYDDVNEQEQIDVHIFNTVSLRWNKLPPVTAARGDDNPLLEVPPMCLGHTAVLMEYVIYIWGGIVNFTTTEVPLEEGRYALTITGDNCNVLYAFEVDTHRWFMPPVSGTLPKARYKHSACVLEKVMYIYGGYNKHTKYTNDFHKLDTVTMVWSLIGATPMPASFCHSATFIGTKMFVFGGHGDQDPHYSNTIRVFETETNDWWLNMHTPVILPERREDHSAFAYNGELYIFGGNTWTQTFDDMWKFSPETLSWRKVEPKGEHPLWCRVMCCCMVGDGIIIFGGYNKCKCNVLDLSPSLNTLCKLKAIQYGLEPSGLPQHIKWELAAMSNGSSKRKNSLET